MVRNGVLLMGPAGSGKSTLCHHLQQQYEVSRHRVACVNLDPAAEYMPYEPLVDIRELITADDAAEELQLGPNGSLVFCIEYLEQHKEWLEEKLLELCEDDLLLFDLPGQIELFVHLDSFRFIFNYLEKQGFRFCVAYCLDVNFFTDAAKSISGSLLALNAMLFFELPHVNILTKCDLVSKLNITTRESSSKRGPRRSHRPRGAAAAAAAAAANDREEEEGSEEEESDESDEDEADTAGAQWAGRCIDTSAFAVRVDDADPDETEEDIVVEQLLSKDVQQIVEELDDNMPANFRDLHRAFASVLEEFGLVSFYPLNISNENSIINLGTLLRSTVQADEDDEPRADYDYQAEA